MSDKATYKVSFRRRRDKKTNYKKRLALLKSGKPRLVVRTTNKQIIAQLISYNREGDKTEVSVSSKVLKKFGWNYNNNNLPAAYLTGFLCGLKGKQKGITEAILDIGNKKPVKGSLPFSTLKGAVDSGLNIPHNVEAFPSEDRINGKHISEYASKLNEEETKKIFSGYLKNNVNPKNISNEFEKIKNSIKEKTN